MTDSATPSTTPSNIALNCSNDANCSTDPNIATTSNIVTVYLKSLLDLPSDKDKMDTCTGEPNTKPKTEYLYKLVKGSSHAYAIKTKTEEFGSDGRRTFKDFRFKFFDTKTELYVDKKPSDMVMRPYGFELIANAENILIVEGEKDADAVNQLQIADHVAISAPFGGGSWNKIWTDELVGKNIIICSDRDPVGASYILNILKTLNSTTNIKVVCLPGPEKDASDIIQVHGKDYFLNLLEKTATLDFEELKTCLRGDLKDRSDKKPVQTVLGSNCNDTEEAELKDALNSIPADQYDTWIKVLIHLYHWNSVRGKQLAQVWSSTSKKYDQSVFEDKWSTLPPVDPNLPNGSKCIFAMASNYGWPLEYSVKNNQIIRTSWAKIKGTDEFEKVETEITSRGYVIVTESKETRTEVMYGGLIIDGDTKKRFDLPASLWANGIRLAEKLKGLAGEHLMFDSKNHEHLSKASQLLEPHKKKMEAQDFGWNSDWTEYFGVECVIDKDGIHEPGNRIFDAPEGNALHLGLTIPKSKEETKLLIEHILNELMVFNNEEVMRLVIGTAFIAPFNSFFRKNANATNPVPSLFLQGTTSDGKTTCALLGQCFYGVVREGDLTGFNSTKMCIAEKGWFYKDALYCLDDLKFSSMPDYEKTGTISMLQSYIDGHGKGRLGKPSSGGYMPTEGKPIRGTILGTGEDLPSGEASIMGRYMIVPIESSTKNKALLGRCLELSKDYSSVMSEFIYFILQRSDWQAQLLKAFDAFRNTFEQEIGSQHTNLIRVCSQLALNQIGLKLFLKFAKSFGACDEERVQQILAIHHKSLSDLCIKRIDQIKQEKASVRFLETFCALLKGKQIHIDGTGFDMNANKNSKSVGFFENGIYYINPPLALDQVQRCLASTSKINFASYSLGQQLKRDGLLAEYSKGKSTVQKRQGGSRDSYWAIKEEVITNIATEKPKTIEEPEIITTGGLFDE